MEVAENFPFGCFTYALAHQHTLAVASRIVSYFFYKKNACVRAHVMARHLLCRDAEESNFNRLSGNTANLSINSCRVEINSAMKLILFAKTAKRANENVWDMIQSSSLSRVQLRYSRLPPSNSSSNSNSKMSRSLFRSSRCPCQPPQWVTP